MRGNREKEEDDDRDGMVTGFDKELQGQWGPVDMDKQHDSEGSCEERNVGVLEGNIKEAYWTGRLTSGIVKVDIVGPCRQRK